MRRSTVLNLPLQLVFPVLEIIHPYPENDRKKFVRSSEKDTLGVIFTKLPLLFNLRMGLVS